MSARCVVKLLLLVTLLPLALRAASLLLAGHAAVPASSASHRHDSAIRSRATGTTAVVRASASVAGSAHGRRPYRQPRHRRRTIAALDGARRLRQADVDGWFEDDKRLAPTGSNPLHNLRR